MVTAAEMAEKELRHNDRNASRHGSQPWHRDIGNPYNRPHSRLRGLNSLGTLCSCCSQDLGRWFEALLSILFEALLSALFEALTLA